MTIMMKTLKRVIAASALCAMAVPMVHANETSYKSAMFGFSGEQLAAQLGEKASVNKDASTVLYCQSEISESGTAQRTNCYDKNNHSELVSSVEAAMATMGFTPAQVDGKAVPVRMSYRVGLSASDSRVNVVLIPNLGSVQERYGRDYIAPQERLDVSNWYDRYSNASWVNGEAFLGHGAMARVSATVDANGKTELVRAMDTERAFKRDAKIVRNAVKKSRFIPGFVDGKAVPMGYLAVVNYGDRGEAVSSR